MHHVLKCSVCKSELRIEGLTAIDLWVEADNRGWQMEMFDNEPEVCPICMLNKDVVRTENFYG